MKTSSTSSCAKSRARSSLGLRIGYGGMLIAVVGMLASPLDGYVRLTINGVKLGWGSSVMTWRLNSAGTPDVDDGSLGTNVQAAFDTWENAQGSNINFVRQGNTSSKNYAGADHIVYFDQSNSSGFFPSGSGIVAITPITFQPSSGLIQDADIIFNGKDFSFATDGMPGAFDIRDVLTHEIGHFIGLDHSPVLNASLWPYVTTGTNWHSSLSHDDRAGAHAIFTAGNFGRLRGSLEHIGGAAVKGAVVAAIDVLDGRLVATALSDGSGDFTIRGLPAGSYWVYAAPLEGAMTAQNITSTGAIQTHFAFSFYGGFDNPTSFAVPGGGTAQCGNLQVAADANLRETTPSAAVLRPGESRNVIVWGQNFPVGTRLETKSPFLSLSGHAASGGFASATVTVDALAPLGFYDLYLSSPGGSYEAATGAIDVVAPAPTITSLDVGFGPTEGGTTVTIQGTNFQDGGFVLFGGKEANSWQFVNATTLQAVTPSLDPGAVDVVVILPDGQQARLENGYQYQALPTFTEVFPTAGHQSGGTRLLVNGRNFDPAIAVRLGSSLATVNWISSKLLEVYAPPHAMGSVDLSLSNPSSSDVVVPNAFEFVATPDPVITGFSPGSGRDSGGSKVTLTGNNLNSISTVIFGTNPVTGSGGKNASTFTVVDSDEVRTTAPSFQAGSFGIKVVTTSGQGMIAPATFTYTPSLSSGGGGGCGGVIQHGGRTDPWQEAPAVVLLILGFLILRRRVRPR